MGLLFKRFARHSTVRYVARTVVSIVSIFGLLVMYSPEPDIAAQAQPKTIVVITVTDSAGTPVKDAFVNVHPVSFQPSMGAPTNASGVATVQDFASQLKGDGSEGDLFADVYPPFTGSEGLIAPDATNLGKYIGTTLAAKTIKFKGATKTLNVTAKTPAGKAVSSTKLNFFKERGGFAQKTTDSAGKATVKLSGGRWNIHADNQGTNTFVMTGPPVQASFAENDTAETIDLTIDNFASVDAKITGTIKTADGSALPLGLGLGVSSGHEGGFGGPVQPDGSFSMGVPGDKTYDLNIFTPPSNDPNAKQWGAPNIEPFAVKAGETKNLGTITLVQKTVEIKVTVENATGAKDPFMAFAFKMSKGGGGEFSNVTLTVGSDGNATGTIKVTNKGKYGVMVESGSFGPGHGGGGEQPKTGTAKVVPGGPQFVDAPGTVKVKALDAKATLKGVVKNKSTGVALSSGFGGLEIESVDSATPLFVFAPIQRGTFERALPAGKYKLRPMFMMGGLMQDTLSEVTLADGETKSIDVNMVPTDATIAVKFVKSDGTAVSGIFAHALATRVDDGVHAMGDFAGHGAGAAAVNNIKVVSGKEYRVGAFVEPGSGFAMIPPKDKVKPAAGETKEVKITMKALDSKIKGKVTDPDGNAVVGAFVKIDNGRDDDREEAKGPLEQLFEFGGQTDKDGNYSLDVTSSETQNVRVFMAPDTLNKNGWLPPAEQIAKVGDKETKTGVDFKFRKADFKFEGVVKDDKGNPVADALVNAYADDGAVNQVRTGSDGKYSMNATKDTTWHLDVVKDASEKDIQTMAGEKLVNTKGTTANLSQDLSVTTQTGVLPADQTRSASSDNDMAVTLTDNFNIQIPADALDKDNDGAQVTVTVNATAEIPNQEGATTFGKAYDVTANASGEDITAPNSPITMTMPYKESDLPAGVKETDIIPVSFDESTGAIRQETGYAIDTEKNQVVFTTSHMTVFGLAANADTTPPAAPTEAKATAGVGKVSLSWKNPTDSDFNGVAIYRSTEKDKLGDKVKTTAKADTSYDDSLSAKGTYYYTLRSVDTTGNESQNTDQVSAEVKSLPTTGRTGNVLGAIAVAIILGGATLIALTRRNAFREGR